MNTAGTSSIPNPTTLDPGVDPPVSWFEAPGEPNPDDQSGKRAFPPKLLLWVVADKQCLVA